MTIFSSSSQLQQGCVCDKRAQLLEQLAVKGEACAGPRDTEQDAGRGTPSSRDSRGRRGGEGRLLSSGPVLLTSAATGIACGIVTARGFSQLCRACPLTV